MGSRFVCTASCAFVMLAGAFAEGLPWRETLGYAEALRQQHRLPEAERILVAVLAEAQRVSSTDPRIGVALNNLGCVYQQQGKYLEAERSYQRSLLTLERALGVDHPYLAKTVLVNLGELYLETGQYDKAEHLLDRALEIVRRSAPDPETLASVEDNLAALYIHRGKYEDARPLLDDALALYTKSLGPAHARTAAALNNFAVVSFVTGKREEAFAYARRALAILEPQAAQQPAELAKVLGNLGLFSLETADAAGAEACLKRAIAVAGPALGDGHPVLVPILRTYADLLRRTHRKREAKAAEQRAERIQARNARDNALGMTVDAQSLLASKPGGQGMRP